MFCFPVANTNELPARGTSTGPFDPRSLSAPSSLSQDVGPKKSCSAMLEVSFTTPSVYW